MFFSRRTNAETLRRLLVVEDDPLVAFDHEYDLSGAGYDVIATVNCGEAAVAALAEFTIDAVILDLNIEGDISGADVARLAYDRGILVLLVSGDAPGTVASFIAAYLAKPLANGAVVAALRALEAVHCRSETPRRVAGMTLFPDQGQTATG